MDCDDRELLETFIEEAKEYLEVLNSGLLSLEKSGTDKSLVHSIFRAAHSLKGNAALIGLDDIKELSHSLESVFEAIRDGTVTYSGKMYDTLFNTVDKLSLMLDRVINGNSSEKDYSHLITLLKKFIDPDFTEKEDSFENTARTMPPDVSDCEGKGEGEGEGEGEGKGEGFDAEIILAFCDDTKEIISSLEEDLLSLENTPSDQSLADSIFNRLHSLTGGASFLSMESVCEVSLSLERLISVFKTKPERLTENSLGFLGYLFAGVDLLRHILDSSVNNRRDTDCCVFLSEIRKFCNEQVKDEPEDTPLSEANAPGSTDTVRHEPILGKTGKKSRDSIRVSSRKLDETIKLMGEMISNFTISGQRFATLKEAERLSKKNLKYLTSILSDNHTQGQPLFTQAKGLMGIIAIEEKILEPAQVVNILHNQKTNGLRFGEAAVSMGYLGAADVDRLMALQELHRPVHGALEELKEIKKKIRDVIRTAEFLDQTVKKVVKSEKQENLIHEVLINDLKNNALKMRMLPLSTLFNTFARFVRDTGRMVNKSVVLEISGEETELDRKMIEKLGDPLIHMIRNSIDHGIEPPSLRNELKKDLSGKIRVSGRYEGGAVLIEVKDDGKGIDPKVIAARAVKKGLYSEEELGQMSDEQVINLIFHPGFSTTDTVTEISGRGVGLDVVKKNIVEDLKGAVDIKTVKNQGTTFKIRLPVTLALIKVMNICIAEHQFAIPLTYITEIINIPASKLVYILDKAAFLHHDVAVPVINLADVMGIRNNTEFGENSLVLIVSLGDKTVGFKVDAINGEENTVIKPLPPIMKDNQLVSGVKISAENEIVNILHIPNILKGTVKLVTAKSIPDRPEENLEKRLRKILLVDDSEMALKHEKKILESAGYNVDTAGNAFDGIKMIKNFNYDLVITDIEMPEKDGFTLTHELRRLKEYREVPVIVSSSLEKKKFRQRAKEVGANGYIVKKDFCASTVSNILKSLTFKRTRGELATKHRF